MVETEQTPALAARSHPVAEGERIVSIDVLRGVAVLGILVMNIQSFGLIGAAYFNPTALGEPSRSDYLVWLVEHVLADRKFMTIFSMLFGAGIVLMTDRADARGARTARVHYRRMGILLLIGMAHAYMLWFGDVLFHYAVCGCIVFLFRHMRPRKLIVIGAVLLVIPSVIAWLFHVSVPHWPAEQAAEMRAVWAPSAEKIAEEIDVYRGGWIEQMSHRAPTALFFETMILLIEVLWRGSGTDGRGLERLVRSHDDPAAGRHGPAGARQ